MRRFSLFVRLYALVGIFSLALAVMVGGAIRFEYVTLLNDRIDKLQSLTQAATSVADYFKSLADRNLLTEAEAKREALAQIGAMRYNTENFIFVDDGEGTLLTGIASFIGRNFWSVPDKNGYLFIADSVTRAIRDGSAISEYILPRPGEEERGHKLGFYFHYKPWGWVLGTGVYVDDIDRALWRVAGGFALSGSIALGLLITLAWAIVSSITRPMAKLGNAMAELSGGHTGFTVTGTEWNDEVGRMAKACQNFKDRMLLARSQLVDAISSIPEGFVLYDAEDRLVLSNARFGEILHVPPAALVPGVSYRDLVLAVYAEGCYVSDVPDVEDWVARRGASRMRGAGFQAEHRLSDGRWWRVSERPTSDGGTVAIHADVTEERQRETTEKERAKLAALGQLAGGVAHEINNLIQPVISLPELIRDRLPQDDTESSEDLQCIEESAQKVREIVRNILLFARREDPRLVQLDLVAELRAAIGFVRDLMPPSVRVQAENFEAHAGSVVAANKTQLTQVVTNLLVNAAQATIGQGTVTVSVSRLQPAPDLVAEFALDEQRNYLAVSVSDTGCGMDEATRARIFEPFFTTKPIGQGTGLGLSVAYGILQSWHGAITVRSAPGAGTTFFLYVPLAENAV